MTSIPTLRDYNRFPGLTLALLLHALLILALRQLPPPSANVGNGPHALSIPVWLPLAPVQHRSVQHAAPGTNTAEFSSAVSTARIITPVTADLDRPSMNAADATDAAGHAPLNIDTIRAQARQLAGGPGHQMNEVPVDQLQAQPLDDRIRELAVSREIAKAKRKDCRTAYANATPVVAAVLLLADSVPGKGCQW